MEMEIDKASAIIGIICVALFALPFILDRRRRRRKGAHLLAAVQGLARQHQGAVHRHEAYGDGILGLDERGNQLFHYSQREGNATTQQVPLARVRACQVLKAERGRKGAQDHAPIDRVELGFLPADKSWGGASIVLFSASHGAQVNGEVQFAERWAALINQRLTK